MMIHKSKHCALKAKLSLLIWQRLSAFQLHVARLELLRDRTAACFAAVLGHFNGDVTQRQVLLGLSGRHKQRDEDDNVPVSEGIRSNCRFTPTLLADGARLLHACMWRHRALWRTLMMGQVHKHINTCTANTHTAAASVTGSPLTAATSNIWVHV